MFRSQLCSSEDTSLTAITGKKIGSFTLLGTLRSIFIFLVKQEVDNSGKLLFISGERASLGIFGKIFVNPKAALSETWEHFVPSQAVKGLCCN